MIATLLQRLDRSPPGRRLRRRCLDAAIDVRPTRWWLAQGMLVLPAASCLAPVTGTGPVSLWAGLASVRIAGALLLRSRRGRADRDVEAAALALARHLATELGTSASAAEALVLRAGMLDSSDEVERRLVDGALALEGRGVPVAVGLVAAASGVLPGGGRAAVARLATLLALAERGGAGSGDLERLATTLEERRRLDAELASAVAEVRMVAVAVPLLTLAVGLTVASSLPGATAVLAHSALGALVVACAVVAVAGAVLARRIAARPLDAR